MLNVEGGKQSSLVGLFLFYLLIFMLLISAITFLGSYWASIKKSQDELRQRVDKQFGELTELLKSPLWHFNDREVNIIGGLYLENKYASFLVIENGEREVVYREGSLEIDPLFSRKSDIYYRDTVVGHIQYSVSGKYLDDLQKNLLWNYFLSSISIILVTLIVVGMLLRSFLEKSFQGFIAAVNEFSAGNEKAFNESPPYKEFKPLINALRNMARERSHAEAERSEAVELKEKIITASSIGMCVYDDTGQCIAANDSIANIIGATRDQVLQQNFHTIEPWKESGLYDCAVKAISSRSVQHMEVDIKSTFSKKISIECLYVPINIGRKDHLLLMVSDISERRETEHELSMYRSRLEAMVDERTQELRDAQSELLRKERLATLGQLTATVSHELRNPLGAMKPSVYMLKKICGSKDEKIDSTLERLDRNIDRCDHIIDELLDFTRSVEMEGKPVDVDEWLEWVVDEQIIPEGICVTKDFALKNLKAVMDADRLRRAVINVIENACHAMLNEDMQVIDKENARLDIKTCNEDDRILIIISDTGSGIKGDELKRIFEPLFSTKVYGVGLGMSTVKQIMKQHGGDIDIESEFGKGTKITLWLPKGADK